MKKVFIRLWEAGKSIVHGEYDKGLNHSWAGRILSSLTLIVIIICLAIWITVFLVLKDRLFLERLSGTIFTNLTCLTFFGGLVIAIFVGALAGNFLKRGFWKLQARRRLH
jgi:hypothetical protein